MGHLAEEKIKILYEDSLKDIRELTRRMEHTSEAVVAATEIVIIAKNILSGENQQVLNDVEAIKESIGKVAQHIAGGAMATDKGAAISRATNWAVGGALTCALVFGGTGYALRAATDAINLSTARDLVSEANTREDTAVAAAEKKAHDEIGALRKSSGWIGTAEGRLAKKFFDSGAGAIAAKCVSSDWEIVDGESGKFCVPKKRDLFGGDTTKHGWKIP